jgi:hypothetical protein
VTGGVPAGVTRIGPGRVDAQSSPCLTDSLAKDPDFIKVGFHIGRFVTAAVNTEAKHADIQTLQSDLDSAFLCINVSSPLYCLRLPFISRV